jgi:hypothetical protein
MIGSFTQLLARSDSPWNHGIGVNNAAIASLYPWRPKSGSERPRSLDEDSIGAKRRPRFAHPAENGHATCDDEKKNDAPYDHAADSSPTAPPSAPTTRMPHCESPNDTTPRILGEGGSVTTLVAVAIPVRNWREKGKYLKYPADTYLCIAPDASRVGKDLHKYYLLITRIRGDRRHRKSPFPFRNLAGLRGCGYRVLKRESEVRGPCAPRVNIESQWQPRK